MHRREQPPHVEPKGLAIGGAWGDATARQHHGRQQATHARRRGAHWPSEPHLPWKQPPGRQHTALYLDGPTWGQQLGPQAVHPLRRRTPPPKRTHCGRPASTAISQTEAHGVTPQPDSSRHDRRQRMHGSGARIRQARAPRHGINSNVAGTQRCTMPPQPEGLSRDHKGHTNWGRARCHQTRTLRIRA